MLETIIISLLIGYILGLFVGKNKSFWTDE